jgi:hypothetical protein
MLCFNKSDMAKRVIYNWITLRNHYNHRMWKLVYSKFLEIFLILNQENNRWNTQEFLIKETIKPKELLAYRSLTIVYI